MHDQLIDGRGLRVLTVFDNCSRASVSLEPAFRLSGQSVAEIMSSVARQRLLPRSITVERGTEFTSNATGERGSIALNR